MEEEIKYHTCTKCGEEKPLTIEFFSKRRDTKFGWIKQCRLCKRDYDRQRRKEKSDHINKVSREYYHRICKNNPEFINKRRKYREDNKEKSNKQIQDWYYRNKEKRNKQIVERRRQRYIEDPFYKMKDRMRTRVKNGITNKHNYTLKIMSCPDWETFKEHIENQFTEDMSWDNQGEWHYDHYYPKSLAQTHDDMFIFNHYTNFQPLWAKDNLSKSNQVPDGFEGWYEMMKTRIDNKAKV